REATGLELRVKVTRHYGAFAPLSMPLDAYLSISPLVDMSTRLTTRGSRRPHHRRRPLLETRPLPTVHNSPPVNPLDRIDEGRPPGRAATQVVVGRVYRVVHEPVLVCVVGRYGHVARSYPGVAAVQHDAAAARSKVPVHVVHIG